VGEGPQAPWKEGAERHPSDPPHYLTYKPLFLLQVVCTYCQAVSAAADVKAGGQTLDRSRSSAVVLQQASLQRWQHRLHATVIVF
jgi:hypothetical protein